MFKQTEFKGYDNEELAKFYESQFKQAMKLKKDEKYAHEFAAMMVEMYGHQFRSYKWRESEKSGSFFMSKKT